MVTLSFTEKDLGTMLQMVKSDYITINESGSLELPSKTQSNNTNADFVKLQKENEELKKLLAQYDTKEVDSLSDENTRLRDSLKELTEAHEKLVKKCKEMEAELAFPAPANNEAIIALETKVRDLEYQLENANQGSSVDFKDSQEYKDLVESNQMLESTAQRLAKENEELQKELALQKVNPSDSNKVQELEARLEKAKEIFKQQKAEIDTLKSNGGNIDIAKLREEIETECKAKANKVLSEQWGKLQEQSKQEAANKVDEKVKELTGLWNIERERKDAKIKELESKVYAQSNQNAKGVPFTLVEFVDKCMPMIVNHLNPTQKSEVESVFKRMAKDLTECYAEDYKEESISGAVETDEDIGFKTPTQVMQNIPSTQAVLHPDEKGNPPVFEQEELPF